MKNKKIMLVQCMKRISDWLKSENSKKVYFEKVITIQIMQTFIFTKILNLLFKQIYNIVYT